MSTDTSFQALAHGYAADWARMSILTSAYGAAEGAARRIAAVRDRYEPVAAATKVPWFVVGLLHLRESSLDFTTHLHNGDPLARRTVQVPAGRPVEGHPPFSWEESAIDALRYDRFDRVGYWPLEVVAWKGEGFNGFGPRYRGLPSGYLWAGSDIYRGGKFVADGRWDPSAWDKQLGILTVLRRMIQLDLVALAGPSVVVSATIARSRTPEDLQRALNRVLAGDAKFEPLTVDGSIGRHTRAATRLFQARAGLADDGVAGPLTWEALEAAIAKLGN